MSKIAVDVVLLPPDEIMDLAIDYNSRIIEKFDPQIILDKKHCLPHASLFMGGVDEKHVLEIGDKLSLLSNQFLPIDLTLTHTYSNPVKGGPGFCGFAIEKISELQLLNENLVELMKPYSVGTISSDMFYADEDVDSFCPKYVEEFSQKQSSENYFPHITLALGEPPNLKDPFKFTASRLALCHLGDLCTCRKILTECY